MKEAIKEKIWTKIEEHVLEIVDKFKETFEFNESAKYVFMEKMDEYEALVLSKFMHTDVIKLDRHKIAAITICSVIDSSILKHKNKFEDENFLYNGNEKIALCIGLSYMKSSLLTLLQNTSEEGKFNNYSFPKALTCETDYMTILCRNLYYAKTYFQLNPIDLSNTLFLIENYSLIDSGVNLDVLRDKIQKIMEPQRKK